jgi:hypothetical protein
MTFKHQEAFCLMSYVSDDGKTGELLWNSRDGVTPFVVHSRDGVEMTHVDWASDICAPYFRPPPGMRVFVDMTEELALEAARENVEKWWDHPEYPMSSRWATKEDAAKALAADYVGGVTTIETPARPPAKKGPFGTTAGGGRFA